MRLFIRFILLSFMFVFAFSVHAGEVNQKTSKETQLLNLVLTDLNSLNVNAITEYIDLQEKTVLNTEYLNNVRFLAVDHTVTARGAVSAYGSMVGSWVVAGYTSNGIQKSKIPI